MRRFRQPLTLLTTCMTLLTPLPALAGDLQQDMQKAGTAMTRLIPFLYNDTRFRDPGNRTLILQQLEQLTATMEAEPRLLNEHAVLRQISQATLLDQLREARSLFNTGNYATAQYLLAGVPILCSNCHIQDGVSARNAPGVNRNDFANDFSYAEFNYYIRQYNAARTGYEKHLQQPDVKASLIQGGKTLERLLDIALITGNDLSAARQTLRDYQNIPGLELELKTRIDQWLTGLDLAAREDQSRADLEQRIYAEFSEHFSLKHEFLFDETRRPLALLWRAELQKRSRTRQPPQDNARNLYLVAILERMLGEKADVSLANLYLKECVALKVADYSLKCLNEYENHQYFYYGGSEGENLPPEAIDDIARLRKQLTPSP